MNVILFTEADITEEGKVVLTDYRARHIIKVLKSELDDRVRMGELNGPLGSGRILQLHKKFPFCVELAFSPNGPAPGSGPVDIVLALPRPIMLKRILTQLAPLGVGTLHVIQAGRVEKSFWQATLFEEQEYLPHLIHGLEQAVDTVVPSVYFYRNFKIFMNSVLPQQLPSYQHLLLAHPAGSAALNSCLGRVQGKILLAIGPEGGWLPHEADEFMAKGFRCFTIGPRILKVDTAVVNIHGRIMALLEAMVR